MNVTAKSLLLLCLMTGASGCVSSYKHVLVSVVDSNTREPVAGATVSTSYFGAPAWSRASRRSSKAVTDQSGTAILSANYLPAEPTLLGGHRSPAFEPMYNLVISNDLYEADQGIMISLHELVDRPEGLIPKEPDIVFEVTSKKDEKRLEAEAEAKRQSDELEADRLFRDAPDFWPEHKDPPYPFPKDDVGQVLLGKRWERASKNALGSKEDIDAIRAAVIRHMEHPQAKVGEIRWVSPTVVMVMGSWYSSPMASAGYTYVLRKTDLGWTVLAYYMNYIS